MQFTGERYVPVCDDPEISYEHWHRYLYASQFVAGKAVLDIASGEGYGSEYLARSAGRVIGVDMDPETVRHAASRYIRPNLEFRCGSAEAVPLEGSQVLDVVVSFETIEHIGEQQQVRFLGEVKRLLRPGGALIVSTPNKLIYTELPGNKNPFHRREFYFDEYTDLLRRFFRTVHILGQKVYPVSYIWPASGASDSLSEFQLAQSGGAFEPVAGDHKEVLYLLALCSDGELEQPGNSVLLDSSERAIRRPLEQLTKTHQELREAAGTVAAHERTIQALQTKEAETSQRGAAQLRQAAEEYAKVLAAQQDAAGRQVAALHQQVEALAGERAAAQSAAAESQRRVEELTAESEAARRAAQEQQERADASAAQVRLMAEHEKELRELLLDAHDNLLRRDEEIQATWTAALSPGGPTVSGAIAARNGAAPAGADNYPRMVEHVREVVRKLLPADAAVLVVGKGDDELLRLDGRKAAHFPQDEHGAYAGYHPADDAAAISHLEALRARGAGFLVFPGTSLWWLDHYQEFRRHLERNYREVVREDGACLVYDLRDSPSADKRQRPAARKSFGVNVAGNITSEKGVGEAVRSDVRSLEAAGIPVVLNNFLDDGAVNCDRSFANLSDDNPHAFNLVHVNADVVPLFVERRGDSYFRDRYNIAYWVWELSAFPDDWDASFRYFDEIWVPSNFVLDAISRASPVPVVRVPHSIPERLFVRPLDRAHFGIPEGQFIFLYLFDFHSQIERKHPAGLIEAFRKAFGRRDGAALVLKSSRGSAGELAELRKAAAGANVHLINEVLSREDINTLLSLSDCYVSLHRSEGFGLTLAEAMSLEKPVIATGYSGNMDFMTPSNSFLVNYRLTKLAADHGPYKRGCVWADPDLDHAAELMRLVYGNRAKAREVGGQGRQDILQVFRPKAVGKLIKERLLKIAASGKVPPPEGPDPGPEAHAAGRNGVSPESDQSYRQLVRRIRDVVRAGLPPDATVLVVSKGDAELLDLAGREAWHFPQQEDGVYAGHHPADSAAAIDHLEALRAKGAGFLLLPSMALWWLEYYPAFRQHLEGRYRRVQSDESCVIYDLSSPSRGLLRRLLRRLTTK
jgi:SAM-dependent methyltransferase/glycosyltransferase involved in cell wall biosynthesis